MTTSNSTAATEEGVSTPAPTTPNGISHFDMSLEPVEHSIITIEGIDYQLALPDDHSIATLRSMNRMWKQIIDWGNADTLTPKQAKEYDEHINALCKLACPDLPKEFYTADYAKKFPRSKKSAIVTAFFLESLKKMPMTRRDSPTLSGDLSDITAGLLGLT